MRAETGSTQTAVTTTRFQTLCRVADFAIRKVLSLAITVRRVHGTSGEALRSCHARLAWVEGAPISSGLLLDALWMSSMKRARAAAF